MTHEETMEDLHNTASNYADLKEYENITNIVDMHKLFRLKFYELPKYKDAKAKGNCNRCYGRGYKVPSGGGRLHGCTCLRDKK